MDFDCHHGNGTEELLRDNPDYFFASIHAVGEHFYPGTGNACSAPNVLSTCEEEGKELYDNLAR